MYQQYVNEARTTQYQQQCQREAAAERLARASRPARRPAPAVPAVAPWGVSVAAWLRGLMPRRASSH